MKFRPILAAFALFIISYPAFADINANTSVSATYTNQIQSALDTLYGPHHFVAIVSVDVAPASWQIQSTSARGSVSRSKLTSRTQMVLPGYQAVQTASPEQFIQGPVRSSVTQSMGNIRKIRVQVFRDRELSSPSIGEVTTLIQQLIPYVDGRDAIVVKDRPFFHETIANNTVPASKIAANPANSGPSGRIAFLLMMLGLVLFGVFILVFWVRTRPQQSSAQPAAPSAPTGNMSMNLSDLKRSNTQEIIVQQGDQISTPFQYVSAQNIDKVIQLASSATYTVGQLAILLSYLRPTLAAQILASLAADKRAQLSVALLSNLKITAADVEAFEKKLKLDLLASVGGIQAFRKIFSEVSGSGKQEVLETLRANHPDQYQLLRPHLILFQDLQLLDAEELKLLLESASIEVFSVAVAKASPELIAHLKQSMTDQARALLDEFVKYKEKSVSAAEVDLAQDYVLGIMEKFDDSGKIPLRTRLKQQAASGQLN